MGQCSLIASLGVEIVGTRLFGHGDYKAPVKETSMVCHTCAKKGARIRYVTRSYGKGEDLLIIENVPVVSCPNCGESYFEAETLHEIERIKSHRQSFARKRQVAVAQFA